ncbi:uncharacterized protein LOC143233988 isoform X3 [Tachypleus tridentatus]|uniref:uncharacterized protein LOC143233988 isoform X3 n=1 Tax=Tachypleus tridentatus TaxID=6853 RepID=UPI003FD47578
MTPGGESAAECDRSGSSRAVTRDSSLAFGARWCGFPALLHYKKKKKESVVYDSLAFAWSARQKHLRKRKKCYRAEFILQITCCDITKKRWLPGILFVILLRKKEKIVKNKT